MPEQDRALKTGKQKNGTASGWARAGDCLNYSRQDELPAGRLCEKEPGLGKQQTSRIGRGQQVQRPCGREGGLAGSTTRKEISVFGMEEMNRREGKRIRDEVRESGEPERGAEGTAARRLFSHSGEVRGDGAMAWHVEEAVDTCISKQPSKAQVYEDCWQR